VLQDARLYIFDLARPDESLMTGKEPQRNVMVIKHPMQVMHTLLNLCC